jgi:hypothetical protein
MSNYDLARNPNTPPEALERLANDESSYVRRYVALNPNTPPEALEGLANDEEYWHVRCAVASNTNTQTKTLERLANDNDFWVRSSVELNPNTPQYIRTYFKIKRILHCYE